MIGGYWLLHVSDHQKKKIIILHKFFKKFIIFISLKNMWSS